MSGDDDLDDLFGAFDGHDNDNANVNVNVNVNDDTHKDGIDVEQKPKQEQKQVTCTNYTNIMSQATASSKDKSTPSTQSSNVVSDNDVDKNNTNNDNNSHDMNNKDPRKTTTDETPKEISTGTSHDKSVRSYSAYPKNYEPSVPQTSPDDTEPAKRYPFPLDPFQQQAVNYIQKNESVLVAAHTSAGKTAVAEYAVALSLKAGQRVVYTSPIKALSNQKFRDLQQEFDDVGLMTGDITINPTATALVMTTEILRSMLYRGSEIMREVAWVIYDEVHYMRDVERGVVWEESIILLPHRVRFVFLSATIPNATQFADWIAHVHHQPCHVVYTNYRPVPLQHYVFPAGGDGLHLVVDERGKFRESNFQQAIAMLQGGGAGSTEAASAQAMLSSGNAKKRKRSMGGATKKNGGGAGNGPTNDLHRIVKLIMQRNLNPVIIFSFSKKDCEKYALGLHQEDYTDDIEKDLITQVYTNAIDSLGSDDQQLPQVLALLPLLKRGIGIHHGGLLPILKEIVEILFSEGLIKALFATETFSIGINMPAKTVVFTNTRKWDGKDFRWVTSGEYIQMSGRAGRRGKDDRGIVIQMLDEKMEPSVCKGILYGDPDPLNSSYKIKYNMLLNMMRVEDVDPEYLLRASFHQYQKEKDAPGLLQEAQEFEQEASQIKIDVLPDSTSPQPSCDNKNDDTNDIPPPPQDVEQIVSEYYQMDQQLYTTQLKMKQIVNEPQHILKFLINANNVGRFIDVVIENEHFGWGIVVKCQRKPGTSTGGEAGRNASHTQSSSSSSSSSSDYTLDVLLQCVDRHFDTDTTNKSRQEDMENSNLLWRGSVRHCRPLKKNTIQDETKQQDDIKLASMRVFTIELQNIERISAVKVSVAQDIHSIEARRNANVTLNEVKKRFPQGIPLLDPITDLKIKDPNFQTLMDRAKALTERISSHTLSTTYPEQDRNRLVQLYETKTSYIQRAKVLKDEARACETIALKDDLKKMKRVLKKLGHVDVQGVIQTKGRCACEINTANELVVVELIFTGVFNDLSVEQCVALLSCMTYDERNKDDDDPTKGMKGYLANPFLKLQEVARTVAKAEIACKIELDEDEFVDKFNPGMMEAVFAWCKGAKFVEVQKLTGSFEGTTIRTLRRLEELNRQIVGAAKSIGNHELQAKFEKGSDLLKRDIVFCSSLYL